MSIPLRGAVVALAAVLVAAGCGAPAPSRSESTVPVEPAAAVAPRAAFPNDRCDGTAFTPLQSFDPGGSVDDLRAAARRQLLAQNDDRLVVGTSGDVLLWGSRNSVNGLLEGFDIRIVQEVARALWPEDGGRAVNRVTYKVISYGQRLPSLQGNQTDIVAHTMTINCDRWKQILFSSEYYRAGQRLLVRTGGPRSIDAFQDAGLRVCVPAASTNVELLEADYPDLARIEVADVGECLVRFQQGEVDGITGDDTVLAGFAAQDPYAEVVGDQLTVEPYGIGVKQGNTALVRFVNAVLQELRENGRWGQIYAETMGTAVEGRAPAPPADTYGR